MEGAALKKPVAAARSPQGTRSPGPRPPPPRERVRQRLAGVLPEGALASLPRAWERLGRVLVLRLPPELEPWRAEVARAYAEVLRCDAVLRDAGPIRGATREPVRELLWGTGTETIHTEGGVRFALDAARIMWSKGNVTERQRIPRLVREGEVVVDLFAGIGYFSVPIAAKTRAARVIACEQNPVAFRYLQRNAALNGCGARLEARPGDCREVAPRGAGDRVLMGYTVDTERFLPAALEALRPGGGVLHYHEACPAHLRKEQPWRHVRAACEAAGRTATLQHQRVVKNYAPGMVHAVVDAEVR